MDSEARDAENVTGERYSFLLPDHSCGTVAALEEIFPMGKQLHSHQSMGSYPVFFGQTWEFGITVAALSPSLM